MSFGFNLNLDALNSLINLQNLNNEISASTRRLSSGLKIASPADGPSQFVQANSLQTQIDGLNTVIADNQNSLNLFKTGTDALSEISSLVSTIKTSALDAANNVTLNPAAAQADQAAIQTAIQSINSIVGSTNFGGKKLLDGSAGVSAAVTNTNILNGINFAGAFGTGVTQSGSVTVTVNTAASYAVANGAGNATYANVNSLISTVNGTTTGVGGNVTVNGQTIAISGNSTVQTLINNINAVSNTTGVSAGFVSGNGSGYIQLTQQNYGAYYQINESETAKLVTGTGSVAKVGINAVVSVTANSLVNGVVGAQTVTFTGGRAPGDSGLRASDSNGNVINLTQGGNTTATVNQNVATVTGGYLQFQVGSQAGQTASIAFPTVFASNLGTTSVPGSNLSTIDVTTATGAANAQTIAQEALNQVNIYQAQLGGFQNNVLQSSINVLNSTVSNLTASVASIQNVDIASESANLTNLQIIQQSSISALKTAISGPSYLLKLLQ